MRQRELKFEFKFEIPGVGGEIPTREKIDFFKEISLLFQGDKVDRQAPIQRI